MSRTKIVGTIGPASDSEETIAKLLHAGLNVARVNFSHGDKHSVTTLVKRLRKVATVEGKVLAILGDLQGPKIRIGKVPGGTIELKVGEQIILSADPDDAGKDGILPFPHGDLVPAIKQGARLVIGDGELTLQVMAKRGLRLHCAATVDGPLGSRKGINLPATDLPIPSITEKDKKDLVTAIDLELDYIALSFVRTAQDIIDLRELMNEYDANIPIIAKIEKREAVECLSEILEVSDGLMVARGDLGLDMATYEVPFLQKQIIRACNEASKPVITATQMLQSMTELPTPTRAEATDVANAILDGSDAVMLSAETAAGKFPVKSVQTMRAIAKITEENFPYDEWEARRNQKLWSDVRRTDDAISSASAGIAKILDVAAIVTTTVSGSTAQKVARWRPKQRIIALTPVIRTQRKLALVWGVESVQVPRFGTIDEMTKDIVPSLARKGFNQGERVVVTAGVPFGRRGLTNMIQVYEFTAEDLQRASE